MGGRARVRSQYSDAFKRQVVSEAMAAGASVAAVARRHGLNGNLLFGWRKDPRYAPQPTAGAFVPVMVTEPVIDQEPTAAEAVDRRLQIAFGERVRVTCLEDIEEPVLLRLARVFGRLP